MNIQLKHTSIFLVFLLFACNQPTKEIEADANPKIELENNVEEEIQGLATEAIRFERNQAFEIQNLKNSIDSTSSGKSMAEFCGDWLLTEAVVKHLISDVKPIDGVEMHHLFDHLPCEISGTLLQNNTEFGLSINGGAWLTIESKDTILMFGNFKEENDKYFSDSWTPEEK